METFEMVEVIELNENNCREYSEAEFLAMIEATEAKEAKEEEEKEPIKKGDRVRLHGSVRVGRGCNQVKFISGEVISTTKKAICVEEIVDNTWVKTWVPKSAIYDIEKCTIMNEIEANLKSWFVKK